MSRNCFQSPHYLRPQYNVSAEKPRNWLPRGWCNWGDGMFSDAPSSKVPVPTFSCFTFPAEILLWTSKTFFLKYGFTVLAVAFVLKDAWCFLPTMGKRSALSPIIVKVIVLLHTMQNAFHKSPFTSQPHFHVTFPAKTYTNGFVLNGQSHWVAIGNLLKAFTKAVEVLEKPLCFFFLAHLRCWKRPFEIFSQAIGSVGKSG